MSNSETYGSICALERHSSWKHLTKMGTEERLFLRSWQQNFLLRRSCGCHCCCYITLSLGRSHLGGNFMAIFSRKGALFWSPPHLLHPSVMFSGCRESRFSSVTLYSKALNISTPSLGGCRNVLPSDFGGRCGSNFQANLAECTPSSSSASRANTSISKIITSSSFGCLYFLSSE